MHRISSKLAAALTLLTAVACRSDFKLANLKTNETLYTASLKQFQRHKWTNAISGFEKLTTDLPARDTLLPRSYWYLAEAHRRGGEHLLAAQSYNRLMESFPDDTLADDAGLDAAREYKRMWRKPQLDPLYGETALQSYNTLVGLYPQSSLIPTAQKEIGELENWFAIKDYDAGMYYFRRKLYDSGMIYFNDILTKYGNTPTARDAGTRLVQSYLGVRYNKDAQDMCAQLRGKYPGDKDVQKVCRGVAPPATKPDSAGPAAKPSGTR